MSDRERGLYVFMLSVHGLIRARAPELGRDADTGGQVTYVLEVARALAQNPQIERVDLATRLIEDASVSADYADPEEEIAPGAKLAPEQSPPTAKVPSSRACANSCAKEAYAAAVCVSSSAGAPAQPGRSGMSTRKRGVSAGSHALKFSLEPDHPWKRRSGSPAPTSRYVYRRPRSATSRSSREIALRSTAVMRSSLADGR